MPSGRFDDLRSGVALRFPEPERVITAACPNEVADALDEVDAATRAGAWAFGYLAYEAASGLDPGLRTHPPDPEGPPLVWFGVTGPPDKVDLVEQSRSAAAAPDWQAGWTESNYHHQVNRVRQLIAEGELYQCNLTVRMSADLASGPAAPAEPLYADLAYAQRGAYCALLDLGDHVIASASPELFFEWNGDHIVTRPMKGTATRGRDGAEDARLSAALFTSPKERAENIMIVDLMRNDLARIARTGGVHVDRLLALERYETVWQLTSQISARLRPGLGLTEVMRALFPCGSVTGAPKQRTMQIITDLEDHPRGVYCGAIGCLSPPGADAPRARFSVAIRTAVIDRRSGSARYGTGGGITWASDPAAEHAELLIKAEVLRRRSIDFRLWETVGYRVGDGIRDLPDHLARMAASADYFGFAYDDARARAAIAATVDRLGLVEQRRDLTDKPAAPPGAVLRLELDRFGRVEIAVRAMPVPTTNPVRLQLDSEPIDSRQPWPRHKTSIREPYQRRRARHPTADDVIMINERGRLTETTIANLAVRLDGRWFTPPVSAGCLPGIRRGRLLAEGTLVERDLGPDDLAAADGIAVINSVRGWRAAQLLAPGTETAEI